MDFISALNQIPSEIYSLVGVVFRLWYDLYPRLV